MKNKKGLYIVLFVLCCTLVWAYYSFVWSDYLAVLPSHPKALATVNIEQLAKESGLEAADAEHFGLTPQDMERIGVNWSKDVFSFITAKEYVGLLAAVADEDKLTAFFESLNERDICGAVEKVRGVRWVVLHENWLIGYDDEALLLMGPAVGADINMLRQEMLRCFRQDSEESGCNSPLYDEVKTRRSSVSLITTLDALPAAYNEKFRLGLPEHATLGDITVVADFLFEPSKLTLNCEIGSRNEEINKYYEKLAVIDDKIHGRFISAADSTTLLWGSTHIEGQALLEELRKDSSIRTFLLGLNMSLDADLIIRSINGDAVFRLDSIDEQDKLSYTMMTEIDDKSFLDGVDYWTKSSPVHGGIRFSVLQDDDFRLDIQNRAIYIGVKDDCFYMSSHSEEAAVLLLDEPGVLSPWSKAICDSRYFVWVNMEQLARTPFVERRLSGPAYAYWAQRLATVGSFVLYSKDPQHIAFEMTTKDNENLIKAFLE